MSFSWVDASRFARHTKVIAVADVVESVRLMEQDEQQFIRRWHSFVMFAKAHLPQETGRMHKSLGDGLMMEFSDPQGCIRAALALQAWFNEGNRELPPELHVHLRIGAHIAEFVADEHDIYGTDVNLTARIATLAGPGEIVISAALRERIGGELEEHLEDLGVCHLKHVRQPVHAWRVGHAGRAPVLPAFTTPGRLLARVAVAVLPFASEPGSEGLGEVTADEIVAALTRVPELQVLSRLAPAGTPLERANYLLRGHARRSGDAVAVFGELSDVSSGDVVWAQSMKGKAGDLYAEDNQLVRALVAGIASGVMVHEAERAQGQPLPTLDSHTVLFAAVAAMHRLVPSDMEQAREMLEQLIERNRRHPAAYAWLAHWHVLLVQQGWGGDRAEAAHAARALMVAALQAESHSTLALCMDGEVHVHLLHDLATAAARYGQVLHSRPDDALGLLLHAELLALRGDGGEAHVVAERALRLCALAPLRYWYENVGAQAALAAGNVSRALALAESAVIRQPALSAGYCTLAIAQQRSGSDAAAGETVQRLLVLRPGFSQARFADESAASPAVLRGLLDALARAGLPAE